jgi:LmbE family N-acetylglucosaminyl deacetylase
MNLKNKDAEIYVPDGVSVDEAVKRANRLVIAAHQDDIELMAFHGVLEALKDGGNKLFGVVATTGSISIHGDDHVFHSVSDIRQTRIQEQKEAADLGKYSAIAFLSYSSHEVKDCHISQPTKDLIALIDEIRPHSVYLHNPFDRHDTHVALCLRSIDALREAAKRGWKPEHVYGCEVWRGLDWLVHCDQIALAVHDPDSLSERLVGKFKSQLTGTKHYDLAARGRRIANATYHEATNMSPTHEIIFAVDLLPLIEDPCISIHDFVKHIVDRFESDILNRIDRYRGKCTT